MANLLLRSTNDTSILPAAGLNVKGSPLTNNEVDRNFLSLEVEKFEISNLFNEITDSGDKETARTNLELGTTDDVTFTNLTATGNTINLSAVAVASGVTKTINIGTNGQSNSTTNIQLGSATSGASGTVTVNSNFTAKGATINLSPDALTSKTINIGTGGASASTTNIVLGSATAGALGTTTIHSPTVNLSTENFPSKTINIGTGGDGSSTTDIVLGSATSGASGTVTVNSDMTVAKDLTITGNLTVNGTETIVNTQTLQVEDQNIELGKVANPTNATANTGGLTILAGTDGDKTWRWLSATSAWTSSEHLNLVSGKEYKINNVSVLTNDTLGSGVVNSSLTSVGTLTSGTWNATTIAVNQGGTGQTTYTNGQLLIGNTTGNTLTKATLTGTSNRLIVTNGAGSITLNVDATHLYTSNGSPVGVNKVVARDANGDFAGNKITAIDFDSTSDAQLKENVHTIEDALSIVSELRGVRFDWKESKKESIGVIAQEVEQIVPEVVSTNSETGYKSVSYGNLVGLLIEAVKELKSEIDQLKKQ